MTNKKTGEKNTEQKKDDVKLHRHEAAAYIKSTYGTMSVWFSIGRHKHLQPFKENGKVYYWKSNLDYHKELDLKNNPA
jgi:hypothetical protein